MTWDLRSFDRSWRRSLDPASMAYALPPDRGGVARRRACRIDGAAPSTPLTPRMRRRATDRRRRLEDAPTARHRRDAANKRREDVAAMAAPQTTRSHAMATRHR